MMDKFNHREMSVNKNKSAPQYSGVALLTGTALVVAISPLIVLLMAGTPNSMGLVFVAMFLSFVTTPVGIIIALIGCIRGIRFTQNEKNEGSKMWALVIINMLIILAGLFYGMMWLSHI